MISLCNLVFYFFSTKTKLATWYISQNLYSLKRFKKSYLKKKKRKATTMVFVENTSYQGYFRVKSLVWVSFIKRIVSVKLDIWRFLLTKPVYRWLNWSPTEQPKNLYCTSCHSNNQNTTITEAKKTDLGYNLGGRGAGPIFTQRLYNRNNLFLQKLLPPPLR